MPFSKTRLLTIQGRPKRNFPEIYPICLWLNRYRVEGMFSRDGKAENKFPKKGSPTRWMSTKEWFRLGAHASVNDPALRPTTEPGVWPPTGLATHRGLSFAALERLQPPWLSMEPRLNCIFLCVAFCFEYSFVFDSFAFVRPSAVSAALIFIRPKLWRFRFLTESRSLFDCILAFFTPMVHLLVYHLTVSPWLPTTINYCIFFL